jgi:hypothetical protein
LKDGTSNDRRDEAIGKEKIKKKRKKKKDQE